MLPSAAVKQDSKKKPLRLQEDLLQIKRKSRNLKNNSLKNNYPDFNTNKLLLEKEIFNLIKLVQVFLNQRLLEVFCLIE